MSYLPAVIIGGGGHAKVVLDIIQFSNRYQVVGYTDPNPNSQLKDLGINHLGGDFTLQEVLNRGIKTAFMGVGDTTNIKRADIFRKFEDMGFIFPVLKHPNSSVSGNVILEKGVIIMAGATVNSGTELKENVIINTGAILEHDCLVEKTAQIGPGVILCGSVRVRKQAFIGAGSCIIQGLTVGERAVVGAGSVVINDVLPDTVVVGNPARPI